MSVCVAFNSLVLATTPGRTDTLPIYHLPGTPSRWPPSRTGESVYKSNERAYIQLMNGISSHTGPVVNSLTFVLAVRRCTQVELGACGTST